MIIKNHKLEIKFDDIHTGNVVVEFRGAIIEMWPTANDSGFYLFIRTQNILKEEKTPHGTRLFCENQSPIL